MRFFLDILHLGAHVGEAPLGNREVTLAVHDVEFLTRSTLDTLVTAYTGVIIGLRLYVVFTGLTL
jgi:hypothetical protein